MYYSPVRHTPQGAGALKLACVKHIASIHSEPGSRSHLYVTKKINKNSQFKLLKKKIRAVGLEPTQLNVTGV